MTPCMYVYKAKIQFYGSIDQLKFTILVRGDLHNKYLIGYTWSPAASMKTFKYFLQYAVNHNARAQELDFIGEFLQAKVKNVVFVKLDSRYV